MRYVLDALPRSHSLFPGIAMALIRGSLARSLADRLDYRLLLMGSIGYGTLNYAVLVHNEDPGRHSVVHFTDDAAALTVSRWRLVGCGPAGHRLQHRVSKSRHTATTG